MNTKKIAGIFLGIFLCLVIATWFVVREYKTIVFGIEVKGHLKRAADANTVEMATKEMNIALNYLEAHNLTEGYTSIIYKTPDEDIGFWYQNLKQATDELNKVNPETTQLEKSNLLMKLRETLLDDDGDDGPKVTVPAGIAIYPYNKAFCIWGIMGLVLALFGWLLIQVFAGMKPYTQRSHVKPFRPTIKR